MPVDLEVRAADHHVEMDGRAVHALRRPLPCACRRSPAERDVRGRVLVEQRVEVGAPGLADARRRVDERDLAEPAAVPPRVAVDVRGDEVAVVVRVGLEPDEPAAAELAAQPVDQPAVEESGNVQRNVPFVRRRRRGLVNVSSVGMFGAIASPSTASSPGRRASACPVPKPRSSSVPGPRSSSRSRPSFVSSRRAAAERAHVLQPAARAPSRPRRSSRQNAEQVARRAGASPRAAELRVDLAGPVVGRPAGDRPARAHVRGCALPEGRGCCVRRAREVGRDAAAAGRRRGSRPRPRRRSTRRSASRAWPARGAGGADHGETAPSASSRPYRSRARMTSGSAVITSTNCAPPR